MTGMIDLTNGSPHTGWADIVAGGEVRKWGNVKARHSTWTGEVLRHKIANLGVEINQFARMTGANKSTVARWLSGKADGDIPLWVELVIELLERCPDTRLRDKGMAGRPRIPGEPRDPPNFPPPRAKRWRSMEEALGAAKPTVSTMTDDELMAEYQVYDAMEYLTDAEVERCEEVVEQCLTRRLI